MEYASYKYSDLAKKYDNFTAPAYEIHLGGMTLRSDQSKIASLEVELAADGTAGGCSFAVEGMYDAAQSEWAGELLENVTLGAKLVVNGGYVRKKELFYGYVDDYTLDFSPDGAPRVQITGIDGLGFLMSQREPCYAGQRKAADIVREILNKSVSAGFAKKVSVGQLQGFETPLVKEQVDDWRFLNLLGQRYGATLMAVGGELIFDTLMDQSKTILTLTMGQNLQRFQKRMSLAHQVGQVEIFGRDVNQKAIKGTASSVTVGGSGKSAAQLVPTFKNTVLREYSEFVRTQEECRKLAQVRLNGIAMGLISGEGQCVGIPELTPGRYLEIDGSDDQVKGLYFLTKVRHLFTQENYQTAFEFKGAKL